MNGRERKQLRTVMETFLAPQDHGTPGEWLHAAGRSVRGLLGADIFLGLLPSPHDQPTPDGFGVKIADGYPPETLRNWPGARKNLEGGLDFSVAAMELRLAVATRRTCYGSHLKTFYRSGYYNDFCAPNGALDTIQITVPAPGGSGRAMLIYNRSSPTGPRFGRRAFEVLWTLYPAFHAAANRVMAGAVAEPGGGQGWPALDALRRPVVVSDLNGRWIHATSAVAELLAKEDLEVRGQVADRIKALAQGFRPLLCTARREGEPPATRHRLRTRHAHITLMASLSAPDAYGAERTVVVELERTKLPCEVSPESLRQRVGLTQREMDVAMLLARRRSNVEVSEELQISPHTARHHTERVLSKLQVHARGDVERALEEAGLRMG